MGNFDIRKLVDSFLKMNITTWLSLVLAVITLATPALSSEPRVVCYYTNWSVYRPGTARFNPQNINPYLCTHLIYAFGGFTKDNTLKPFDKYQDIEKGGYAKFTGLKTYNKNLKTLLAIGGWNEGSTRFSPLVASRENRKEFVRNVIKFLRQNRFDGLDLDWEYPAFRDGGKPKDRENYAKLVKELREEFEKEAEKTGKPRLLLTMAVPAGIEYIQKGFDLKAMNQHLDWMNLLAYDYHSAFEPAVNHHAPLYPLEEPNEYSVDNELNIDYTIKFYLENGADRDKIVLGIPTYGRSYTLFNPDAYEIGSPADGPGEQGDATREKGYLAYYEICEALKPKDKKRSVSDDSDEDSEEEEEEEEPWTVMHPNPKAMGPVAFKGNQWVGYDDVDIVKRKAEYVAENGLGGIMFWSIDNDDFRGNCHGKPYPLIEAAKEAYIVSLGSTDNVVVTDKPKSSGSKSGGRRRNRPKSSTTTTTTTTTPKPTTAVKIQSNKRKSASLTSTTPAWNIVTPEPPTTPDPGADFKCTDEGFFPHPRDCKKYFWCLDSGPSNLGIVAHQFTCPSGLFFNKAADSCDFARNVLCKKPAATTKPPTTKATTTTTVTTTTTTRKPARLSTKNSLLFRTTTTTTTPEPESEEEYEDEEVPEDAADVDAEDPRVIKELIDLIKKVGGVEKLEKHLHLTETSASTESGGTTPRTSFNNNQKLLYQKVLERTRGKSKFTGNSIAKTLAQNSRKGPQNAGIEKTADADKLLRKDRPQYTTINRSRPTTTSTTPEPEESEEEEQEEVQQQISRGRAVETEAKVGTTAKPLQYVNIRRARPNSISTSDTADDSASRNALFERSEPFVTVSEEPASLDIASARRENVPEYVTIRRQRPTTEETTTVQYRNVEQEESELQGTALEKEISSQPQYTSIVRTRATTLPPEEPSSPEPTTILAVQISSLLNSPSPSEQTEPETPPAPPVTETEAVEIPTTTPTTTTTTTTAAPAPSSLPTRRPALRRRGSTSTTTTTTTSSPSSVTQAVKERRPFLRRTKATSPPDTTETTTDIETTTNKFTRRGNSRFKSRNDVNNGGKDSAPSLNTGAPRRNERPRTVLRRRPGGVNASTTATSASSPSVGVTRRPFRVASRRRPFGPTITTSTTTTTTEAPATAPAETAPTTTAGLASEESLQEIEDTDFIEDPSLQPRTASKKTPKIQRRPLVNLKEEDQNPSATNEEERKRQSKKYSAKVKQNQLDEVLKKTKTQEEVETTTEVKTTVEDYNAETALAIAAHQLLTAPVPSIQDFDDTKPTRKLPTTVQTTPEFTYTSPEYTDRVTGSRTIYSEEFTSTPAYKTTLNQEYQTTTGYTGRLSKYEPKISPTPFTEQNTGTYNTEIFTSRISSTTPRQPTIVNDGFSGVSQTVNPSTARYLGTSEKYIPVPVEDYGFSTGGYSSSSQEPAYFTREYLLESPVTKTYDDEYQYLSPVTTPQTTTRKLLRKTVHRKISTTLSTPTYVPSVTTPVPRQETYDLPEKTDLPRRLSTFVPPIPTVFPRRGSTFLSTETTPRRETTFAPITTPTPFPRRVPSKKPFEKIPKEPKRTYRPIDNYDYYDDSHEKVAEKYAEGTKVVLHGKGNIECLDIGNFPHPTSCKKFISCARIENGSLLGWEYICPKGLSFDPVGGICNWSAGLGCNEKDI